jgi:hypothetical protein
MLSANLDALLARLSVPATPEEQARGWTPQAKAGIASYFRQKKAELAQGSLLADPGLVRGLDAWGVSGGDLYDAILNFNRQLP